MTKDELTIAKIEDRMIQSRDGYYVTATGFLDSHEQALARKVSMHAAGIRTLMYGGYDDAGSITLSGVKQKRRFCKTWGKSEHGVHNLR